MNCPGRPALCQTKHGWRDRSKAFMVVKLSARHRLHLVRLSFAFQVKLLLIPASSLMQSMIYFKLELFIEGGAVCVSELKPNHPLQASRYVHLCRYYTERRTGRRRVRSAECHLVENV